MRTPRQIVGSEEPSNTGSSPKSRKTVLMKKRGSKSSRLLDSDHDTIICTDSSEHGEALSERDLEVRIALRAHELYEQRGGCHGEDQADWFEAERQILATA